MNLSQILEALPPRVYLRSGELVVQFSSPQDLLARVAEAQSAFADLDRGEPLRQDGRGRGRGRGTNSQTGSAESDAARSTED